MRSPIYVGNANPLPAGAVETVAREIGCEVAALKAVIEVEASGRWFNRDGTLPRRFEPHKLPAAIRERIRWVGGWEKAAALSTTAREALFAEVFKMDPEAACAATSWGGPQIMGFNAGTVGYPSAIAMVQAFADDAQAQLDAMVSFMRASGLLGALRGQDWSAFARGYNGPGQVDRYAGLLASAYRRHAGQSSPTVLRLGDRGPSVTELQRALGLEADGVFGPDTLAAVRAYQEAEGLPADGIVGARTWTQLRTAVEKPKPAAAPDAFDRRVEQAQKAAGAAGAGAAALRGLTDGLGDTAQTVLAGAVGVAVVALAVAFVIGRLRAGRTA
ncbi:N-acetylmuramidase domain-containing protein [Albimonas pacifica]|uniref:Peptidoglycan-binding (PGRP) domain of peptidoglycan hydrolases-containing protein n=1 Tax=Albimonas pacifica TaxID=1114924 RepID=A0A1I3LK64_9RHOB|nr:N-acetylmuramidase domain-containing protein [Albimonas pacifica]SFI84876.1 Peptidoglycan-binding (PGRP) domain of peptidoglycan hydrolases-containing protein [Albimonas pacifica]